MFSQMGRGYGDEIIPNPTPVLLGVFALRVVTYANGTSQVVFYGGHPEYRYVPCRQPLRLRSGGCDRRPCEHAPFSATTRDISVPRSPGARLVWGTRDAFDGSKHKPELPCWRVVMKDTPWSPKRRTEQNAGGRRPSVSGQSRARGHQAPQAQSKCATGTSETL